MIDKGMAQDDGADNMEIYVARSAAEGSLTGEEKYPKGFVTVRAGAAVGNPVSAEFRDDTGENISEKNRQYDELTVTFWAWKNRRAKVKGIACATQCIAPSDPERGALLKGVVDVLLPLPVLCYPDTSMAYAGCNPPEAVEAMLEAVEMVHGTEMKKRAEKVLGGELFYSGNLLIAGKEAFHDYCAWMFPVLMQVESLRRDLFSSGRDGHVCAHLGEILGTIYFLDPSRELRIVHGKKVQFRQETGVRSGRGVGA